MKATNGEPLIPFLFPVCLKSPDVRAEEFDFVLEGNFLAAGTPPPPALLSKEGAFHGKATYFPALSISFLYTFYSKDSSRRGAKQLLQLLFSS